MTAYWSLFFQQKGCLCTVHTVYARPIKPKLGQIVMFSYVRNLAWVLIEN